MLMMDPLEYSSEVSAFVSVFQRAHPDIPFEIFPEKGHVGKV